MVENTGLQYGVKDFRKMDPLAVNQEGYAYDLYGDQQHYGDVREYNSADNGKHPENTLSLDWASRIGTTFETEAPGYLGKWEVTDLPEARVTEVLIVASPIRGDQVIHAEEKLIPAKELGVQQDPTTNLFWQVKTTMLSHGRVDKRTRERLTKHAARGETQKNDTGAKEPSQAQDQSPASLGEGEGAMAAGVPGERLVSAPEQVGTP